MLAFDVQLVEGLSVEPSVLVDEVDPLFVLLHHCRVLLPDIVQNGLELVLVEPPEALEPLRDLLEGLDHIIVESLRQA